MLETLKLPDQTRKLGDFGYAATLSVVLLAIVLGVSGGAFYLLRQK